jgi:hypothetical protein
LVGTDAPVIIDTVVTYPLDGGTFEIAAGVVLLPVAVLSADMPD